jgi:hypothetical protein
LRDIYDVPLTPAGGGTFTAGVPQIFATVPDPGITGLRPAQNLSHPTDCLGRLLQDAGRTLLKLADGIDPVAPQSGNGASPDDAELKPLLATLESHLADGNMRAMDVYAELRPMLAGIPEDMMAKLDTAFDGLDFGGALHVLRELADGGVIKGQESQAS